MRTSIWLMCSACVVCAACKTKRQQDGAAATPGEATVAPAAVASEGPAVKPPAPAGNGPCVGKWTIELAAWSKKTRRSCDEKDIGMSLFVVRDASGKGYVARRAAGAQDLAVETTIDAADRCSIAITDAFSHRSFTSEHVYTLQVDAGKVVAAGQITESDHGGEEEISCQRKFTAKAKREPISASDLAFDPAQAAAELAALWDSDQPLTLTEYCAEMPVMKTPLPRKAKLTVTVSETGSLERLVIDGVEQGKLDDVCSFPTALEESQPIALTNRSGVTQTVALELELGPTLPVAQLPPSVTAGMTAKQVTAAVGKATHDLGGTEAEACFVFQGAPGHKVCFSLETEQARWKEVLRRNYVVSKVESVSAEDLSDPDVTKL